MQFGHLPLELVFLFEVGVVSGTAVAPVLSASMSLLSALTVTLANPHYTTVPWQGGTEVIALAGACCVHRQRGVQKG